MSRKNRDEVEQESMYDILRSADIPLLTLDNNWHNLFPEGKSKEIERLERELNDALKSQGRINSEREELIKLKQTLLKQIVENMDAEENSRASKKIEKSRDLVQEINDKLILLEDKGLNIPGELRDANTRLLMAGLDELCGKTSGNNEEIQRLEELINETRIELKKKILLREQKIEENERIYKYLNRTVGRDIVRRYEEYLEDQKG